MYRYIYIKGNLPVESYAGGLGVAAGIFDGIDIDWEYPNNPGNGNPYGPEDIHNFTLLLEEFRRQLDEIDHSLLLTIAGPGGQSMIDDMELNQIHQYLDWINLMTYDYHGAWESQGPTNHHSPLFANPQDPSGNTINSDYTVQLYKASGVPADKLNLGIPFSGKGWQGVQNVNNGLFQPANNPAPGTWGQGVDEYKYIKEKNLPLYWDSEAQASWAYDGNIFWSFDTPDSILNKMSYIKSQGLGGAMFWELSGDTDDGELITAIRNGL